MGPLNLPLWDLGSLGTVDLFWYYFQVPASKRVDSGSLYMKVLSWRGSTALNESGSWKQSCFLQASSKIKISGLQRKECTKRLMEIRVGEILIHTWSAQMGLASVLKVLQDRPSYFFLCATDCTLSQALDFAEVAPDSARLEDSRDGGTRPTRTLRGSSILFINIAHSAAVANRSQFHCIRIH